jgi:hypothetical protein
MSEPDDALMYKEDEIVYTTVEGEQGFIDCINTINTPADTNNAAIEGSDA